MVGIDSNQTLGFMPRPLAEPRSQIGDAEMGVALEHLQRLVAGDGRDLHHVQPLFEETARGLMAQVVNSQTGDASAARGPVEGLLEGLSRQLTEDAAVRGRRQGAENVDRAARERHSPRVTVLSEREEGSAPLEVHVVPQ